MTPSRGSACGSPGRIGVKTAYQAKYERVQALQDGVGSRCLDWLREWAPGTLGAGDGLGVPLCLLISLAQGKPFREPGDFMRLLDFASSSGVSSFALPNYIFLVPRRSRKRSREFIAAFSEPEASAAYRDVAVAPEILHDVIFPFMVVLAMEGILASFESRMRGTRSGLADLDVGDGMEPHVADLRNRLLELSRDVAVVSGDIKSVIADSTAVSLWFDYPLLLPVDSARPSPSPGRQASEAPRKALEEFIANLKGQEAELRELVLVTSQAASDLQNAKTQKTLNWLTFVLVVLTVFVFIAALIPLFRSSPDESNPSGTAPASSPVPTHSLHRAPSPSPSVSGKDKHS